MNAAPFAIAQVVAAEAPWRVLVSYKSSQQGPSFPVQVLRPYIDGLRVRQHPLPVPGSWGLIAFPYGDTRNGIWLGAIAPSQIDALTLTTSGTASALDPYIDYESHFSGYWWLRDGSGNYAEQFPDGSYLTVASGTALPKTFRHTVEDNLQKSVEFTVGDRITTVPTAYNFQLVHKTGTMLKVDSSGIVTVSGASGATLNLQFGHTTITVDTSGMVSVVLPAAETVNITQGGSANDWLVLVSKLLTAFNNHKHLGVTTGGGQTGNPVTPLVSGDINSTIIKIQN